MCLERRRGEECPDPVLLSRPSPLEDSVALGQVVPLKGRVWWWAEETGSSSRATL